jgi:hypothetical protein
MIKNLAAVDPNNKIFMAAFTHSFTDRLSVNAYVLHGRAVVRACALTLTRFLLQNGSRPGSCLFFGTLGTFFGLMVSGSKGLQLEPVRRYED